MKCAYCAKSNKSKCNEMKCISCAQWEYPIKQNGEVLGSIKIDKIKGTTAMQSEKSKKINAHVAWKG